MVRYFKHQINIYLIKIQDNFIQTAKSTVPNDQTAFANWLYGTENICKEGSIYMHRTGTPEQAISCNGFNVATPTNFGNLNDYVSPSNE
jgi:hypothetical protein